MAPHAEVETSWPTTDIGSNFPKIHVLDTKKSAASVHTTELREETQEVEKVSEPVSQTPSFPIEKLPGNLPEARISPQVDHRAAVEYCLQYLSTFNADVFTENGIWRDIYALTGLPRTFYGPKDIKTAWLEVDQVHHPSTFSLIPGTSKVARLGAESSWIQARFSFKTSGTPAANCSGQIGLVPDLEFGWKIWFLTTILEEVQGAPSPDYVSEEVLDLDPVASNSATDFDCVIVGAGFAGLCLAGRLKAMGVKYIVIEKNDNIGDNWTKRYDSARFHTSKYYSDMPLGTIFGEGYDYFPTGGELARGYKAYVDHHRINVWLSTNLDSASLDKDSRIWTVNINQKGETRQIKSPHFVLATGAGGTIPKMPFIPGRERFKGEVIHSATYKNALAWKGKKCVIVGTANTAHDVAEDMLDAGAASVTMIQRGTTCVFPIEHYKKWSDPIYNATSSVEDADRQIMGLPIVVTRLGALHGTKLLVDAEQERFDALARAGFRVDRYGDLWQLLTDRLGGHYMDVGASAKVSAGLVSLTLSSSWI